MSTNLQQTVLRAEPELIKQIKKAALEENRTMNAQIIHYIKQGLSKKSA